MPRLSRVSILSLAAAAGLALTAPAEAQSLRWLTQSQESAAQYPAEIAAIEAAGEAGFEVTRNEFQVLGVNLADALRLVGSGAFDLATVQVGSAAKDDPFLEGIDLSATAGTPVRAAAAGEVAAITRDTDQVPILVLRHPGNLLTVYANIDNIRVARGDTVARGQTIADVGAGDPAFLHFEVRQGFESVDPTPYIE